MDYLQPKGDVEMAWLVHKILPLARNKRCWYWNFNVKGNDLLQQNRAIEWKHDDMMDIDICFFVQSILASFTEVSLSNVSLSEIDLSVQIN